MTTLSDSVKPLEIRGVVPLILYCFLASLLIPSRLDAQFIFLDTNGDRIHTSEDRLGPLGASADVILQTDMGPDGSPMRPESDGLPGATLNSYEFILRAEGGTVEWGAYTNLMETMTIPLKELKGHGEYYVGFAGVEALPPGKYVLGRLNVRPRSGTPRIVFASGTSLNAVARTSFGSRVVGKDLDNTLKYTEDAGLLGTSLPDVPGDWSDAAGLEPSVFQSEEHDDAADEPAFTKLELVPATMPLRSGGALKLRLPNTGKVTLRIFDVSGRLVGDLLTARPLTRGEHHISLFPNVKLGSGVYFYRLTDGLSVRKGRLVVLR